MTYGQVECSVDTECGLLGWESLARTQDVVLVSCAGLLVADVAQGLLAAQRCVVWLADRQEVRCEVPRDDLACVDKDVNSEETKGVDTCNKKKKGKRRCFCKRNCYINATFGFYSLIVSLSVLTSVGTSSDIHVQTHPNKTIMRTVKDRTSELHSV